jgi:hypothetical protein
MNRVSLDNLTVAQPGMKVPAFEGNRRFIAVQEPATDSSSATVNITRAHTYYYINLVLFTHLPFVSEMVSYLKLSE